MLRRGVLLVARRPSRLTRRRRGSARGQADEGHHHHHGPDEARVRQAVRHGQRPVAAEPRRRTSRTPPSAQMASETVVSHNTIVSGLLPKHMGWSDEVMRDVEQRPRLRRRRHRHRRRPRLRPVRQAHRGRGTIPSSATTCTPSSRARSSPTSARRTTRSTSTAASSSDYLGDVWAARRHVDDLSPDAALPWTASTAAARRQRARLHPRRPPLQDQRRQRPTTTPRAAQRLLRHRRRQAGLALSRGRPLRPGSVRPTT